MNIQVTLTLVSIWVIPFTTVVHTAVADNNLPGKLASGALVCSTSIACPTCRVTLYNDNVTRSTLGNILLATWLTWLVG